MQGYLLIIGAVILICILMNRFISKLAIPSLLIFIALGMCFGENGIFRISFENYEISEIICSACLIFVMFYGGFGTNFSTAKPVVVKSVLLSSLGVVLTAGLVGVCAHFLLNLPWFESFLIGSVVSSTDAASVFNILRSKKLALKFNTAPLLEIESGSNDPISYMLTVIFITLMTGEEISIPWMLTKQIVFGLVCGFLLGKISIWLMGRFNFLKEYEKTIFVFAIAVVSYALPSVIGGNGYLSVYLCGILLGNSKISQKRYLVHFFDVVTDVAQVIIFFLLGLLVTPANLPQVFLPALIITVCMTFLVRPVVITAILAPFRSSFRQIGVGSWAGLRGVASIVFAIMAVVNGLSLQHNLFNLVFCIVLLSISFQGTLLPWVSKKLKMIDQSDDVSKTFNDYQEDSDISFIKIHIEAGHSWENLPLKSITLPRDLLVVMIERDETSIIPNGDTIILRGDLLILAARVFEDRENVMIREVPVDKNYKWDGKPLRELDAPKETLVILIRRGQQNIIPDGGTIIKDGDILIVAQPGTQLFTNISK